MRRLIMLVTVVLVIAAMMALAGPASAAADPPATETTAQEEEIVRVEVGPTAKLIADGQAVRVKVKVACEPVGDVLEASVEVFQADAYGQGFFGFVMCDGRTHVHKIKVEALDSTFHRGEAFVSAFVLLEDPETGETAQGGDLRLVRVVGS
jgi:hypothetical protein